MSAPFDCLHLQYLLPEVRLNTLVALVAVKAPPPPGLEDPFSEAKQIIAGGKSP